MRQMIQEWMDRYVMDPQVFILGLLLALGFAGFIFLGEMLAPVIAAIVIAFLLEGIVQAMTRFRVPRLPAVIVVFCVFLALLLAGIILLLPLLSRQVGQLIQDIPKMIAMGQKQLMALPQRYPDVVSTEQVRQVLGTLGKGITVLGQQVLSISIASVRGVIMAAVYLILVPLLVFFFLKDKNRILDWGRQFLPKESGMAAEVWTEVNTQVGNYIRGKIWEILIVWAAAYATFRLLGLPFAMLVSVFVGLSVIIPYIGATVMFFPVGIIAYFEWGASSHFIWAVAAYGILQALDGNLLAPLLLSEVVNLHPVAIIVAVLVFGGVWGIWGLFFAIPLATLVHAVIKTVITHRRMSHIQNAPSEGPPSTQEASA